ncbi:CrcB family protein [Microbacterium sp. cx-55]|uniref:fluoride efflux transporter FluC n=1 Tax=Microbacterium sp. cx-55 TaxID=2875948 RepID=UPI001CBEDDFC|nr:CrcB family protein [Microbacterium sp. cx-55]MBZ4487376.1 CrcB family protein [Microbacterium sp. cx-55]UGB35396.1 CrcB family protein [Microbacterium sp. cx-55]
MSPAVFVLVAVAGGVGAGLRYVLDLWVTSIAGTRFPWGTLVINVVGSFALGLLVGAVTDADILAVIGIGILGGFTTFSSVATASAVLWDERRNTASVVNALGTLVLTVAAASGGLALAALLA